jgi:hypothetical protein
MRMSIYPLAISCLLSLIPADGRSSFLLHYPMHAFINLFTYIMRFPESPSVSSDLALLDSAAGSFSQMEFVTESKLSFPFTRDVAAFARKTVIDCTSHANVPVCSSSRT